MSLKHYREKLKNNFSLLSPSPFPSFLKKKSFPWNKAQEIHMQQKFLAQQVKGKL